VYERTYKIKIYDPSRIIIIKGKEVRTPTEAVVSDSELKIIKSSLVSSGCKNFVVEDIIDPFFLDFQEVYNKEVIEPLEKKVVSTYDEIKTRISSKIVVRPRIKPRIKHVRQKRSATLPVEIKFRVELPRTSFYVPLELQTNREPLLVQIPMKKEDFDVKIEDLKIESNGILKKFLKEIER
jgi:hypothetical protein